MAVGDGRFGFGLVRLVGQKIVVGISNFYVVFGPNPIKNAVVENYHYWTGLVGQAGRSKNGYRHFKVILCCFWAIISPHTKFHQNPMKNAEVENFQLLVGFSWSDWLVKK